MTVYPSKKVTKDGRKYFFRIKYKDIFGKIHDYSSAKFKTKKEAKIAEAKYRIKVDNKEAYVSNITLDQVFNDFIQSEAKKVKKQSLSKTIELYKHLQILKEKNINCIDLNLYNEFIDTIPNEFSIKHKNKIIGLLKRLLKYSAKYNNTSTSLIKFIEPYTDTNEIKKEMQFFTLEEYKQFDTVINEHNYHTFFELLYYNGLRQGEAQALTWEDIDFEKKEVRIIKTLTTKIKGERWTISSPKTKNSIRNLPLTDKLIDDLKIMLNSAKEYKDFSNKWFVFGNTEPFKETTIQKKKNSYCDLASVKRIRVHDFRHSCASLLINNGASIALVSKYLGHAKVSITLDIYTHMYKNELNNITELLNKL